MGFKTNHGYPSTLPHKEICIAPCNPNVEMTKWVMPSLSKIANTEKGGKNATVQGKLGWNLKFKPK